MEAAQVRMSLIEEKVQKGELGCGGTTRKKLCILLQVGSMADSII